MKLETKYNIGDFVWVINGKTGKIVQREIMGIRTQFLKDNQKTSYSFIKDKFDPNNQYHDFFGFEPISDQEKYFWLYEGVCYQSKEELKEIL